jgi:hypothetical protein
MLSFLLNIWLSCNNKTLDRVVVNNIKKKAKGVGGKVGQEGNKICGCINMRSTNIS